MKKDQKNPANEAEQKPKMKVNKVLNKVVNIVLVVAIVIAAFATYVSFVSSSGHGAPNIFGVQFLSIQTDSMYPTLEPGDLIIDFEMKDATKLKRGDIITYWTNINGERVLNTHRIENIYDGGGFLFFETKGDKNTLVDTLTVHEGEIVGVYKAKIPGLGKVLDYLQTSWGFLIVVVIPVFLFFLYYLVQFFRVLFEYQNVKNRLKYEQERAQTDAALKEREVEVAKQLLDREALEAELREKLRAELLASMTQEQQISSATATPAPAEPSAEKPTETPVPEKNESSDAE